MSRRSTSPIRTLPMMPAEGESNQRDLMIRKLKEDVIVARGKQKQHSIMNNYLINMLDKTRELQIHKQKADIEQKGIIEATQRKILDQKRQHEKYKNQLRTCHNQLAQVDDDAAQLQRTLHTKSVETANLKKDAVFLQNQNSELVNQKYRIKTEEQATRQQLHRFVVTRKDKEERVKEVNTKIAQVKVFIHELGDQNVDLKNRLKKYQFQNNDMNENLGEKQQNIDILEHNFSQKHEQIQGLIENIIQLDHINERNKKQTLHTLNLQKNETEKNKGLHDLIRKTQKLQAQRFRELKQTKQENNEITQANKEIGVNNQKMKQDLVRCQEHLQNLLKQNVLIQKQMQKYIREDEHAISVIRRKQILPTIDHMRALRSSRALKNSRATEV